MSTARVTQGVPDPEYLQAIAGRAVYFRISLMGHVGFTDQLLLFCTLYKLGRWLGLTYSYTPLAPRANLTQRVGKGTYGFNREGDAGFDGIFDFLGFDAYIKKVGEVALPPEVNCVDFSFDAADIEDNRLQGLKDLQGYLMQRVLDALPGDDVPLVLHFNLERQHPSLRWLHELPNALLGVDLADMYFAARKERPFPDTFEPGKPRVLLHSRQGDTAVIKLPWHTYMQVWQKGRDSLVERESFDAVQDFQRVSVADFERFYSDLKAGLSGYALTTQMHSDGFARAFHRLDKSADQLDFSEQQWAKLREWGKNYNDVAFETFAQHAEVMTCVGEDIGLLFSLVHAFYTADIVVIGTQQRMLAKQYAYSFASGGGPLLITLYRERPPTYQYFRNEPMEAQCVYVNMDDYDPREAIEMSMQFLSQRYPQGYEA